MRIANCSFRITRLQVNYTTLHKWTTSIVLVVMVRKILYLSVLNRKGTTHFPGHDGANK